MVRARAGCASGALTLTGGEIPISLPTLPPSESRPITAVGRGSTSVAQFIEQVVSERLGHTKVAFTLDHYGHVLPGMQEKAAAKLEAILFGR